MKASLHRFMMESYIGRIQSYNPLRKEFLIEKTICSSLSEVWVLCSFQTIHIRYSGTDIQRDGIIISTKICFPTFKKHIKCVTYHHEIDLPTPPPPTHTRAHQKKNKQTNKKTRSYSQGKHNISGDAGIKILTFMILRINHTFIINIF